MKRTLITLYIVVVVVLATATIIENIQGTEYVGDNIYGAWWFSVLWALLTATSIFYFVKRKVRRPSVVVLHLSFVIILVGALLTHLTGVQGVIPLRKGIPTNEYLTRDMYLHKLPFTISLENFEIQFYEGTDLPSDYISHITLDGQPFTLSMNHIVSQKGVRLYQADYDMDMQGSILTMNSDPWGIPVTYCGYALLFLSLFWMLIDPKGRFRQQLSVLHKQHFPLSLFGGVLLICFMVLLTYFTNKYAPSNHPLPVLNSRLLPIHVSSIMMAYLLLTHIFIISILRLFMPKHRQKMQYLSLLMLFPSLTLLGFGIFIGAIWANISWGNYWSWDPKETWALITFMLYAVPAHRSFPSRYYHIYMTLAFLTILMTYFGVSYFLGGMHSYA